MFAKKGLIKWALRVIDVLFLKKLPHEASQYVQKLYDPLAETITALTDDDPNNVDQLKEIWLTKGEKILDDTLLLAADIVEKRNPIEGEPNMIAEYLRELAAEKLT